MSHDRGRHAQIQATSGCRPPPPTDPTAVNPSAPFSDLLDLVSDGGGGGDSSLGHDKKQRVIVVGNQLLQRAHRRPASLFFLKSHLIRDGRKNATASDISFP